MHFLILSVHHKKERKKEKDFFSSSNQKRKDFNSSKALSSIHSWLINLISSSLFLSLLLFISSIARKTVYHCYNSSVKWVFGEFISISKKINFLLFFEKIILSPFGSVTSFFQIRPLPSS